MSRIFPAARGSDDTTFDVALEVVLDGIERRFLA
jgi:hypothetical protein